jgi:hypothetical protein
MNIFKILYIFLTFIFINTANSSEETIPQNKEELQQFFENKENKLTAEKTDSLLKTYARANKKDLVALVLNPPQQKLALGRTRANPKPSQDGINRAFGLTGSTSVMMTLIGNDELKPEQTAIDDKFDRLLAADLSQDNKLARIENVLKSEVTAEKQETVNNLFLFFVDVLSHRMENKGYDDTWSETIDETFKTFLTRQTVKPDQATLTAGLKTLANHTDSALVDHSQELIALLNVGIKFIEQEDLNEGIKVAVILAKGTDDYNIAENLIKKIFSDQDVQPTVAGMNSVITEIPRLNNNDQSRGEVVFRAFWKEAKKIQVLPNNTGLIEALKIAASRGNDGIARHLLQKMTPSPTEDQIKEIFFLASEGPHDSFLRLILDNPNYNQRLTQEILSEGIAKAEESCKFVLTRDQAYLNANPRYVPEKIRCSSSLTLLREKLTRRIAQDTPPPPKTAPATPAPQRSAEVEDNTVPAPITTHQCGTGGHACRVKGDRCVFNVSGAVKTVDKTAKGITLSPKYSDKVGPYGCMVKQSFEKLPTD